METQTGLSLKISGMVPGDSMSNEEWLEAYRKTSNWIRWTHAGAMEFEELNDMLSKWTKIEQIQFNNGLALLLKCHMKKCENPWSCNVKLLAVVRDTGLSDVYLTNMNHGLRGCRNSTEAIEQMRSADSDDEYQHVPGTPKNVSGSENTGSPTSMAHFVEGIPSLDGIQLDAPSSDGSVVMEEPTDIPVVPEGHQEIKYKITTNVTNLKVEVIYGTIYHFECHLWVILFTGKTVPSLVPASVMNKHFPEKVIAFYERRIDWDNAKSNFQVRLAENNPALMLAKFHCGCVTKPY